MDLSYCLETLLASQYHTGTLNAWHLPATESQCWFIMLFVYLFPRVYRTQWNSRRSSVLFCLLSTWTWYVAGVKHISVALWKWAQGFLVRGGSWGRGVLIPWLSTNPGFSPRAKTHLKPSIELCVDPSSFPLQCTTWHEGTSKDDGPIRFSVD